VHEHLHHHHHSIHILSSSLIFDIIMDPAIFYFGLNTQLNKKEINYLYLKRILEKKYYLSLIHISPLYSYLVSVPVNNFLKYVPRTKS